MEKHLYDEIYLVGVDNTVSPCGDLTVCATFEDLLSHLKTKNASIDSDLRILHGVLTSAQSIPSDLKGRQPFIILKDPNVHDQGILLDSAADDDCKELAAEIERMLESEEVASFFFEIDHVYVLYGYELSLTLAADEDELDEEIISACLEIAEAARKLNIEDD